MVAACALKSSNQVEDLGVFFPFPIELDKGDAQAFLVDFRETAGDPAGNRTAHVQLVGNVGHKGQHFSVYKHRGEELHVQQMLSSQIGVVADNHVTFVKIRHPLQHVGRRGGEAEHHERAKVRLGQNPSLGIEDRTVDVHDLLHDRRSPHAHEAVSHVIGHGFKPVANHLHGHRVGFVGQQCLPLVRSQE